MKTTVIIIIEMTVIVFLKNAWIDVEEPRGIQVETHSASEDFKHRDLDMWRWTRKKFWLFTKATHHGKSKSICWTTVIEILALFLRHVRQAVSTQATTAFSHIYSLSTFWHLTSTPNSRRKITWSWNKETNARNCKHKSNPAPLQHISLICDKSVTTQNLLFFRRNV